MLQSLTASPEGVAQVARPTILTTCVQLFTVATPRVQRALLQIFRRVLPSLRPDALDAHLKVPQGLTRDYLVKRARMVETGEAADAAATGSGTGSGMASEDDRKMVTAPGGFVAYLLLALSKAVSIQTRGRAAGRAVTSTASLADEMLPGAVSPSVAASFASLLRNLIAESEKAAEEAAAAAKAAEEAEQTAAGAASGGDGTAAAPAPAKPKAAAVAGPTWGSVIKATLANALSALPSQMETVMDAPAKCAYLPQLWLSLGGLLMAGDAHGSIIKLAKPAPPKPSAADLAAAAAAGTAGLVDADAICDNHQDGRTPADVTCESCGPTFRDDGKHAHFCGTCDGVLHMRKACRDHKRTPIPSRVKAAVAESSATSVDHIEGCTRMKLAWLQIAVYDARMKATVEFKRENHPSARLAAASGVPIDRCRFCKTDLTPETRSRVAPASPALEMVCNSEECEEKARTSCRRVKDCGHFCGGVCDEAACLPCYHGCDGVAMDADMLCNCCGVDNLGDGPTIRLGCGHAFHHECIAGMLKMKWSGPRITFGFMSCPLCRKRIDHETLRDLLEPLLKLEELVKKKALMRLSYENLDKSPALTDPTSEFYRDPAGYAMHRFFYFMCSKCKNPYYGGEGCALGDNVRFNPDDLVCTNCLPHSADAECPKHGRDFITYKCQFCCNEALFFCFGTTHFCDACHSNPGLCQDLKSRGALPHCPAGPLGKQLPGTRADCSMKSKHPEPGEESIIGCSICRNAATF